MERRAFHDEGKNHLLPTSNGKCDSCCESCYCTVVVCL